MGLKNFYQKYENRILALGMTALLFLAAAVCFDFYYDINDDVLIKDILSGVYSGTPEGHTMQLLYPLGFLLALLYRLLSVPVFGWFLCLCQFGSIYCIALRSLPFFKSIRSRLAALLLQAVFWMGIYWQQLIFMQYTVTAGMLAAAAIFWFLTADTQKTPRAFWRENIPAFLLYALAFCLRSEMGLLMLPFAGIGGLCRWGQEKKIFTKENTARYLGTFGLLLALPLLSLLADGMAYGGLGGSGGSWPAFRRFFDARTQLYDYHRDMVENYEENRAAYESLGISQVQQQLLANYNFGVDDRIDTAMLQQLAEAAQQQPGSGFFRKTVKEACWDLKYHFMESINSPINWITIGFLGLAFLGGFSKKRRHLLWQIPLLGAGSGLVWLLLLMRGRMETRVAWPLFLVMILAAAGLVLGGRQAAVSGHGFDTACGRRWLGRIALAGVLLLGLGMDASQWQRARAESLRRAEINSVNHAVFDYCHAHPNQLFLEDVYSAVAFSEKIAYDREKPVNYDLLGGWMIKSPLTVKKMRLFGHETMEQAVADGHNVRILTAAGNDIQWLTDYFAERGLRRSVICVDRIKEAVDVYQVVDLESTGRETIDGTD